MMTHPSKVKGNTFEREVVNKAKAVGLKAERAYASNGKALGESEEVDVMIDKYRGQCKRRKKIASFMTVPDGCDITLIREDRGDTYVVVEFDKFLSMIKSYQTNQMALDIFKKSMLIKKLEAKLEKRRG